MKDILSEGKLYFEIVRILEQNLDKQKFEKVDDYIQDLQVENQKMRAVIDDLNKVLKRHSIK
jgi:hypothetical protein